MPIHPVRLPYSKEIVHIEAPENTSREQLIKLATEKVGGPVIHPPAEGKLMLSAKCQGCGKLYGAGATHRVGGELKPLESAAKMVLTQAQRCDHTEPDTGELAI